jgi:hypothetical protein
MLVGRRAFEGETVSDTLAAVLKEDPNWAALPAGTPAKVREILRKCLRRDARARLHDIADARLDLEELDVTGAMEGVEARRRDTGGGLPGSGSPSRRLAWQSASQAERSCHGAATPSRRRSAASGRSSCRRRGGRSTTARRSRRTGSG